MRRLLLILALLFALAFPSPTAVVTYIRQIGTNTTSTNGTGITVTMPSTTLAGSLLVMDCGQNNSSSGTMSAPSDGSNTYVQVGGYSSVGSTRAAMWDSANAAAVSSVACAWTGIANTRVAAMVFEIVNAQTNSTTVQDVSSSPSAAATSLATGTINTLYGSDIILFVVFNTPCTTVGATCAGDSMTGTGGYAYLAGNGLGNRMQSACRATSATGTFTGTMNWTGSVNADGMVGSFKAVAGSTGTSCTAPVSNLRKRASVVQQ